MVSAVRRPAARVRVVMPVRRAVGAEPVPVLPGP